MHCEQQAKVAVDEESPSLQAAAIGLGTSNAFCETERPGSRKQKSDRKICIFQEEAAPDLKYVQKEVALNGRREKPEFMSRI